MKLKGFMEAFIEKRFLTLRELRPSDKERLLNLIKEHLSPIENIIFAYAHGSFVKSGYFRDIDIAIFVEVESSFFFESDLSAELSTDTGFEVEVRAINNAPLAFQMAAVRDGVLLFSRDEVKRTDFVESVGRRYMEYAHFRNIFLGIDNVRQR
jgi:predicted nucleotidyltransferase